jgi:hypothetical protein
MLQEVKASKKGILTTPNIEDTVVEPVKALFW